MLKQRILTAVFLIPITILSLFYLPIYFFALLTAAITLVGAWEWSSLMSLQGRSGRLVYVSMIALLLFGALFVPVPSILAFAFAWWLVAVLLIICYPRGKDFWGRGTFWRGLMGVLVLVPTWVAINFIRDQADGVWALLFLFILVWGADSSAYFVGKKWGVTKLAPQVSPGKSWQGLLGALLFTVIVALFVEWVCDIPIGLWKWGVLLALVTVLFSVVGDLLESALKRQVNLKDASQLIPGHGGLLDRIDSLTAAAPIFAMGSLLLGIYLD